LVGEDPDPDAHPGPTVGADDEAPADVGLLERVESEMDAVERSLAALAVEGPDGPDPSEVVAWLPDVDTAPDGGTTPAL